MKYEYIINFNAESKVGNQAQHCFHATFKKKIGSLAEIEEVQNQLISELKCAGGMITGIQLVRKIPLLERVANHLARR